ncbi:MAG: DNA polymerase III subunit delta [Clostridia bacterium]|nr:DNA polymerase III subunit delta [Clostridia bacterium]
MAEILNEDSLKKSLQGGQIKPVYILFGDDGYLINRYQDMIIDKTCGKDNDFDLQKFEREVDLRVPFDALNQFPMMGQRKCVIIADYNFESASNDDFDRLVALASDSYEFSTLVLVFEDVLFDVKRSSKSKNLLNAALSCGGCAVRLDHRDAHDLAKMLVAGASKRGKELDISVANYMVETCGTDINTLSLELEKICRYVDGDNISKSDIDDCCIKTVDAVIYDYAAKLISCDTLAAINKLNDLLYMRLEPMVILYSAASAFVDMVRVNAAKKSHVAVFDVAKDFSYPDNKTFLLTKAENNLRRFNDKKLNLCLNAILDADRMLKSFSFDPKTVLEQMTVRIIYIIANGEEIDKN